MQRQFISAFSRVAACCASARSRQSNARIALPRRRICLAPAPARSSSSKTAIINTMDESHPCAGHAIAIADGSIVAVAYTASAAGPARKSAAGHRRDWIAPSTRVIDLHGQFAMPGFNDAHVHLSGRLRQARSESQGAKSLAEFQQRIRDRLKDFASPAIGFRPWLGPHALARQRNSPRARISTRYPPPTRCFSVASTAT